MYEYAINSTVSDPFWMNDAHHDTRTHFPNGSEINLVQRALVIHEGPAGDTTKKSSTVS